MIYRPCSNIITRQIMWIGDDMQTPCMAYVHAAAERKSVNGYEGHISKDRSRYMHVPGAKRIVSADIL